jgi:uncharacterized SAM-binding protein YcdF (DUF218 family)
MRQAAVPAIANRQTRRLLSVVFALVAALLVYITALCVVINRHAKADETHPAGCIVVFGAAEYSGRPSPALRARLDHAADLYARGLAPMIIVSGGAGGDPRYNEGEVGRDYLIAKGIPESNVIAETQSTGTLESAERVARIMRENGMKTALAVSDGYHLYRAARMLRAHGVAVYAAPRPDDHVHPMRILEEAFKYLAWQLHLE